MPRREGMERKDLLAANVKIFKSQGLALARYSKPTTKVRFSFFEISKIFFRFLLSETLPTPTPSSVPSMLPRRSPPRTSPPWPDWTTTAPSDRSVYSVKYFMISFVLGCLEDRCSRWKCQERHYLGQPFEHPVPRRPTRPGQQGKQQCGCLFGHRRREMDPGRLHLCNLIRRHWNAIRFRLSRSVEPSLSRRESSPLPCLLLRPLATTSMTGTTEPSPLVSLLLTVLPLYF